MATTPAVVQRLDRDFDSLESFLDDFSTLVDEWDDLEEGPRVTLSLEWDHLMADYLTELDEHYRAGELSETRQLRYRGLLDRLRALLPLIGQKNFYRPPVSLDP